MLRGEQRMQHETDYTVAKHPSAAPTSPRPLPDGSGRGRIAVRDPNAANSPDLQSQGGTMLTKSRGFLAL